MANKISASSRFNQAEFYGIYRRKGRDPARHSGSWFVQIRRKGKDSLKTFSDSRYGGSEAALAAAREYRDSLLTIPPYALRDLCAKVKSNNTTGTPGLYRYDGHFKRGGRVYRMLNWTAAIKLENGGRKIRSFSIRKYGEDKAHQLAVEARQKLLAEVEGVLLQSPAAKALTKSKTGNE